MVHLGSVCKDRQWWITAGWDAVMNSPTMSGSCSFRRYHGLPQGGCAWKTDRSYSRLPATVSPGKPPGRRCSSLHTCRRTLARTFAIFPRAASSSTASVRRAVESEAASPNNGWRCSSSCSASDRFAAPERSRPRRLHRPAYHARSQFYNAGIITACRRGDQAPGTIMKFTTPLTWLDSVLALVIQAHVKSVPILGQLAFTEPVTPVPAVASNEILPAVLAIW